MFKYILTVLILFFSSYSFSNDSDLTISQQLERLQREVSDLSKEVFSNSPNQSNGTNNDFVKNLSAIDLRIYDIENDIKNLTSNLEELYFQLDDIFNKLENLESVINNFQSVPLNNVEVKTEEASQDSSEVKSNTLGDTETENTLGTLNISKNTNDTNEEVISEDQEVNSNEKKKRSYHLKINFKKHLIILEIKNGRMPKLHSNSLFQTILIINYQVQHIIGLENYIF